MWSRLVGSSRSVGAARLALVFYALVFLYLQWTPEKPFEPGSFDILGHLVLYLTLTVLVGLAMGGMAPLQRVRLVLMIGVLAGILAERVQGEIPGRHWDVVDILANWLGAFVGTLVVSWMPGGSGGSGVGTKPATLQDPDVLEQSSATQDAPAVSREADST